MLHAGAIRIDPERDPARRPDVPTHRATTIQLRTALLQDAVAIVEAEYSRDLSLDEIAGRIASSRRQLQRAFAEIGDTTFRDHLTRVRMRRAAQLLGATSLTVRDVARRVGYRQPAQFAKAFRRHAGVSPSDYRARRLEQARTARGQTSRFTPAARPALTPMGAPAQTFAGARFAA